MKKNVDLRGKSDGKTHSLEILSANSQHKVCQMPRIAEFVKLPDGRMAVVLDVTGDTGEVTLWTAAERDAAILRAVKDEREECAKIAAEWGDRKNQMTATAFVPAADHGERFASDGIAAAIRARSI